MKQKVIKPEDIGGHYDCKVQLLAEPPEATDIRKAQGMNLQKGGVISLPYNHIHYQDMSREESERVQAEILVDLAMRQPALLEVATKDAMKRLGMKQALEELEEAERRASANQPPRRIPETMLTGAASVRKRGRLPSEMERGTTAQESEVEQIPLE